MSICKRSFLVFLSSLIIFCSVHTAYTESVHASDFIIGLTASLSAGPLLTALLVGGVLVGGAITIQKYMELTPSERQQLQDDIVEGFQTFVAEQEKQIALEQDQTLTDQQAADIGVANARDIVNDFIHNCLDVTKTTGRGLQLKTVRYWKEFCGILKDVFDKDFNVSGDIPSAENPVEVPKSEDLVNVSNTVYTNGENTFIEFYDHYYILKGKFSNPQDLNNNYVGWKDSSYLYLIYIVKKFVANSAYIIYQPSRVMVDVNTGLCTVSQNFGSAYQSSSVAPGFDNTITYPLLVFSSTFGMEERNQLLGEGYIDYLSVGETLEDVKEWIRELQDRVLANELGRDISIGRRRLKAEGDYVGTVFEDEGSIPVKKKGLMEREGLAVGTVGWDLPSDDTWDDVLAGVLPFPEAPADTGTIEVPYPSVEPGENEGEVEFPIDEPIEDSDPEAEDEDDPSDPDEPTTPGDVIEDQGGDFYPSAFDLTELFPFCIPFDVIYLVNKMYVTPVAPVINIDYVYPQALRPYLGNSYTLTIDFNDFVTLRNILRVFLLLMFIVGLMKITRDLIRG